VQSDCSYPCGCPSFDYIRIKDSRYQINWNNDGEHEFNCGTATEFRFPGDGRVTCGETSCIFDYLGGGEFYLLNNVCGGVSAPLNECNGCISPSEHFSPNQLDELIRAGQSKFITRCRKHDFDTPPATLPIQQPFDPNLCNGRCSYEWDAIQQIWVGLGVNLCAGGDCECVSPYYWAIVFDDGKKGETKRLPKKGIYDGQIVYSYCELTPVDPAEYEKRNVPKVPEKIVPQLVLDTNNSDLMAYVRTGNVTITGTNGSVVVLNEIEYGDVLNYVPQPLSSVLPLRKKIIVT
jgi:hypothetical protein